MSSKIASKDQSRRTTMAPVTTMEELPVLSDAESAELRATLAEAERQVAAGEAVDYDPAVFKDRLLGAYRGSKR